MTANKAPAGGIVSNVNGQFYEGGQFTPNTGLFCGRGGNKIKLTEKQEWEEKIASRVGEKVVITWFESRMVQNMGKTERLQAGYEIRTEKGTMLRRGFSKSQVSSFVSRGF